MVSLVASRWEYMQRGRTKNRHFHMGKKHTYYKLSWTSLQLLTRLFVDVDEDFHLVLTCELQLDIV